MFHAISHVYYTIESDVQQQHQYLANWNMWKLSVNIFFRYAYETAIWDLKSKAHGMFLNVMLIKFVQKIFVDWQVLCLLTVLIDLGAANQA